MFLLLLPHEWPAPDFSSSNGSSSLYRRRQCECDDEDLGGDGNNAPSPVEMPEEPCSAPGGKARVAEADVTTRTNSMVATVSFLTVDVEDDIISVVHVHFTVRGLYFFPLYRTSRLYRALASMVLQALGFVISCWCIYKQGDMKLSSCMHVDEVGPGHAPRHGIPCNPCDFFFLRARLVIS